MINSERVTKLITVWLENNNGIHYAFIQMQHCPDNLENLINQKAEYFCRMNNQPMSSIEIFICCHLVKELTECLHYLHVLNRVMASTFLGSGLVLAALTTHTRYLISSRQKIYFPGCSRSFAFSMGRDLLEIIIRN